MKENGKTAVFITHSISEALEIGDRIVVLKRPAMIAYDVSFDADTAAAERETDSKPDRRRAGGVTFGSRRSPIATRSACDSRDRSERRSRRTLMKHRATLQRKDTVGQRQYQIEIVLDDHDRGMPPQ